VEGLRGALRRGSPERRVRRRGVKRVTMGRVLRLEQIRASLRKIAERSQCRSGGRSATGLEERCVALTSSSATDPHPRAPGRDRPLRPFVRPSARPRAPNVRRRGSGHTIPGAAGRCRLQPAAVAPPRLPHMQEVPCSSRGATTRVLAGGARTCRLRSRAANERVRPKCDRSAPGLVPARAVSRP